MISFEQTQYKQIHIYQFRLLKSLRIFEFWSFYSWVLIAIDYVVLFKCVLAFTDTSIVCFRFSNCRCLKTQRYEVKTQQPWRLSASLYWCWQFISPWILMWWYVVSRNLQFPVWVFFAGISSMEISYYLKNGKKFVSNKFDWLIQNEYFAMWLLQILVLPSMWTLFAINIKSLV